MTTMTRKLSGTHQHTMQSIFMHPLSHNLQWKDVESLLLATADHVANHDGTLVARRNGHTLVLHHPLDKDLTDIHELMELRDFLAHRGDATPQRISGGPHFLVIIDHREARIYELDVLDSVPQRITPYDPHGYGRYLHNVEGESDGRRKPERRSFYEAVAHTLAGAGMILLSGSGTGASSAMHRLREEMRRHHARLERRVIGEVVVDSHHQNEAQLLAAARDIYRSMSLSSPSTS